LSKKFNAAERLWCKGVATISSGGETTDWSFQISAILHNSTLSWIATSAANEVVLSTGGHVLNSGRATLSSSSMNSIHFFNSTPKVEKEALKLGQNVLTSYFTVFLKNFCLLWKKHWTNFHQRRNTLHDYLTDFRYTVTRADLGGKQCGAGAGWEGVWGEGRFTCRPQFEGMRDFWTNTRTKVFRFSQKFRKVLKCSTKFQCRPVGKFR